MLEWDGEGDSTDGSDAARETPKPMGRLHLLSSKYGPEKGKAFWSCLCFLRATGDLVASRFVEL